ncbi:Mu-like prophage major head subunit gpT [Klebsiella pneumoniae subsp. ozaenae]|uniref:Mu-like prophage major head subunit gpT n=1 Tax=Klebsiella pneumoniae subsp. ozaenae TaxID=574 RepID=A0A378AZX5_KLEPO|nr:Mu-like prophage major head subunit gpT [Klebsiella pneumoniae subsp. ozaenae]
MDSDDVFLMKKYKFGAEARSNGGYGFWQMAFGSTGWMHKCLKLRLLPSATVSVAAVWHTVTCR